MKINNLLLAIISISSLFIALLPAPKSYAAPAVSLGMTIQPLNCIVDVVNDGIQLIISTTSTDCQRAMQLAGY